MLANPAAPPHFEAALAVDRALRPDPVAGDLNGLGSAYEAQGQSVKALGLLRQALPLLRAAP